MEVGEFLKKGEKIRKENDRNSAQSMVPEVLLPNIPNSGFSNANRPSSSIGGTNMPALWSEGGHESQAVRFFCEK